LDGCSSWRPRIHPGPRRTIEAMRSDRDDIASPGFSRSKVAIVVALFLFVAVQNVGSVSATDRTRVVTVTVVAKQTKTPYFGSANLTMPKDWKARNVDGAVEVSSPKKKKREEYTVSLVAKDEDLQSAAVNDLDFVWQDGAWNRTDGPAAPSPVIQKSGDGWNAMYAYQACGIFTGNQFHAAGGTCLVGAISDGTTTVLFDTVGITKEFPKILAMITSVKFVK
jgi:hypothetical protein